MSTLTLNIYDLDRETAVIMGYTYKHQNGKLVINKPSDPPILLEFWNPTINLMDALEIIKRFPLKFVWTGIAWRAYSDDTFGGYISEEHPELPIAICQSIVAHKHRGR